MIPLEVVGHDPTVGMFGREQPFAEFVPSIVALENPFITSLVLNNTQIRFVVPVFLSTLEIKE